jgi:hypothetical protein
MRITEGEGIYGSLRNRLGTDAREDRFRYRVVLR